MAASLKASPTAAVICWRGTGLIAGPSTGKPRPGRVTVPTPSPPSRRTPGPASSVTLAVRWAPWVTSGSSPASLTTIASAQRPSAPGPGARVQRSTAKATRRPVRGRPTSTWVWGSPLSSAAVAALAAAAAQVPVVHPGRRPRRATLAVRGRSDSRSSGSRTVQPSSLDLRATGAGAAEAVGERRVVQVGALHRGLTGGQGGADQHQSVPGDACRPQLRGQVVQRAADNPLVRPGDLVGDHAGGLWRVAARLQLGLEQAWARAGQGQRHGGAEL